MPKLTPIQRYVAMCGSQSKAARRLGVSPSLVGHLACARRAVTVAMAIKIDQDTGGAITRAELRPDVWAENEPGAVKRHEIAPDVFPAPSRRKTASHLS